MPCINSSQPKIRSISNLQLSHLTAISVCVLLSLTVLDQWKIVKLKDWVFWLPAGHLTLAILSVWYSRRPISRRAFMIAIIWHGILFGVEFLIWNGQFKLVTFQVLELILRIACIVMYGYSAVGAVITGRLIYRRMKGRRSATWPAKLWMAVLISLGLIEPLAGILEAQKHVATEKERALNLPLELPPHPQDEVHVVALGGSTMLGHPYEPHFGIPNVVELLLNKWFPTKKIKVTNLAVGGINLRLALNQLNELEVRPDLILLYSGHNEFYHDIPEFRPRLNPTIHAVDDWLAFSATFRMLDDILSRKAMMYELTDSRRSLIESPLTTEQIASTRRQRYRNQLETFAMWCRDRKVQTLWFVPAGSESGFQPNHSIIHPGGSPQALTGRHNHGRRLEAESQWELACELYQSSVVEFPTFAEFHFRLGHCFSRLGKYKEARTHFQNAYDLDDYPVRTISSYCDMIREVASSHSITLIESANVLRPHTAHGLLDESMFHDNVHPTLLAFYLLGHEAAERIRDHQELSRPFGTPQTITTPAFHEAVQELGLTAEQMALAYRRTAHGLDRLSMLCFDAGWRERRSQDYARLAERMSNGSLIWDPSKDFTEPCVQELPTR